MHILSECCVVASGVQLLILQNVSAQRSLGGASALQSAGFTLHTPLVLALSWELCRWPGTALCANSPDCREQPQQRVFREAEQGLLGQEVVVEVKTFFLIEV